MVFSTDGFDISFPFLSLGDESIRVEEKTRDKISILFLSLSRAVSGPRERRWKPWLESSLPSSGSLGQRELSKDKLMIEDLSGKNLF